MQAVNAVDREVLERLLQWLQGGTSGWLATVVATWGSSPRPIGSLMAASADGKIVGSLSGGCVEDDLVEQLRSGTLAAVKPAFYQYGVTPEETERLGLPCGGHLDVVVEPIPATAASLEHFGAIVERLARRQCSTRELDVTSGAARLEYTERHEPPQWLAEHGLLRQSFGPRRQLFIIGAGMVSKYLAAMALSLDYEVRVCDPREELLAGFQVEGVECICDMPDDAIRRHASDPSSAIVALTHDPRIDDMGLLEALQSEAFYIGAMGSRRTSASRRERLLALDVPPAALDRLHAPIGLAIGSKTPPEIAVAILAELISVTHATAAAAPPVAEASAARA
jgi:xanthine dehydrogenase accessory factor